MGLPRDVVRSWNRCAAVVGTGSIGRAIATLLRAVGYEITLVGRTAAVDPIFGTVRASADLATSSSSCR